MTSGNNSPETKTLGQDSIDIGPLSWVMNDIRDSLTLASKSVIDMTQQSAEEQATSILHAKSYVHQAHGALEIVDIEGVANLTAVIEQALESIQAQAQTITKELAQKLVDAMHAVVQYLEDLMDGSPHQPVRLYPYYREVAELKNASRIHPADLFYPSLNVQHDLTKLVGEVSHQDVSISTLRGQFEKVLLSLLTAKEPLALQAAARQAHDVLQQIGAMQRHAQGKAFWIVIRAFAEAISLGAIEVNAQTKQVFGRINLQIRRLTEGNASVSENLLREALFYLANANDASPLIEQVRAAYRLQNAVPQDFETKAYRQYPPELIQQAKEQLVSVKNLWSRIAARESGLAEKFTQRIRELANTIDRLEVTPLAKLMRELTGIARHAAHSSDGTKIGLELASSLLFVEHTLDQVSRLPVNFKSRAEEITQRLLNVVSGEAPQDEIAWIGEISRDAQQKQTVAALVHEMQSSLKHIEKNLDEYFRDTRQHEVTRAIPDLLHQIGGALAILDQDEVLAAVEYTRELVHGFADPSFANSSDAPKVYKQVAQNLGALSFFVESMQSQPDQVGKKFTFDRESGLLKSSLFDPVQSKDILPALDDVDPDLFSRETLEAARSLTTSTDPNSSHIKPINDGLDVPSAHLEKSTAPPETHLPSDLPQTQDEVDAELLEIFLGEADEVLALVGEMLPLTQKEVGNQSYLTSLRRSFHTLKGSSRMVKLTQFGETAWHIEQVMNSWLAESKDANSDLLKLLGEARTEMLAWVDDLRLSNRSSRQGLQLIAAAKAILNGELFDWDASHSATNEVASAVEFAEQSSLDHLDLDTHTDILGDRTSIDAEDDILSRIQSDFEAQVTPAVTLDELELRAEGLDVHKDDEGLAHFDAFIHELEQDLETKSSSSELGAFFEEAPPHDAENLIELRDSDLASTTTDDEISSCSTSEVEPKQTAKIIEFPDLSPTLPPENDNVKRIAHLEISLPLYTIYMAETDEIVRYLTQDFSEWRHESLRQVSTQAIHATHTLAGSSATVGLTVLQELALALEKVLQRLQRHPVELLAPEFDLLDTTLSHARHMLQSFALSELPNPVPEIVQALAKMLEAIIGRSTVGDDEAFVTSTNELLSPEEIPELIGHKGLDGQTEILDDVPDVATTLDLNANPESDLTTALNLGTLVVSVNETPDTLVDHLNQAFEKLSLSKNQESDDSSLPHTEPVASASDVEIDAGNAEEELRLHDELDPDLLPVFIEEGKDLFPMVGELLRNWQLQPEDDQIPQSISRVLHTLKGSARMAGAMNLGQNIHEMETRIESLLLSGGAARKALLDDLLARHDMHQQMFERLMRVSEGHESNAEITSRIDAASALESALRNSIEHDEQLNQHVVEAHADVPIVPADLIEDVPEVALNANSLGENQSADAGAANPISNPRAPVSVATSFTPAPLAQPTQNRGALVRVRADILDRLVNQAGEVSIARSRLEEEMQQLRSSLNELTDNVSRLRDQLREVEIQAETQISSHMAQSSDREFDPLEFDRFTRLQELTRMMAESVSDVATVQNTITRTLDGANNDLLTQARLTRDLQQDLMRVRMVPFASITERLFRVSRQTSKEVDKRVNLDIRGSSVEMDRNVLEKMAGPFEHLLRNAIVHGIEDRTTRLANGKSETGELKIEVRQEGNEVVILFNDDGQGIDVEKIREKAIHAGLLTADQNVDANQTAQLIFHPGITTATEVTELAGRGVGMDVVRSEASALGGRVEIQFESGKGTQFTIRLPLTLAVTQIVLIRVANRNYALPSVLVEQVQQLKPAVLAEAYNQGGINWLGQKVSLYYLASILGDQAHSPQAQAYTPLIIMRSGNEKVAIHVDEIVGNREVVVKNIGPQLARLPGVAGATVLGSGEIVLILDPVLLARRQRERESFLVSDNSNQIAGAVANLQAGEHQSSPSSIEPVQGLRSQSTIMIVDDSLTVRRVTQRLLVREGYQVMLAKDGIDALEQIQTQQPDVMLVDIEMPRMDGFDLTRNIRGDARTKDIPIIMITSRTADKHRNYARELGVNEYFGKPYQEDALLNTIREYLSK